MHTNAKLTALALALATCAPIDVARAQTDVQPAPVPQSMPGTIILPAPRPVTLPAGSQPDAETCPAADLKKLDLIG